MTRHRYLRHMTIGTGDVRDSYRSDVADDVVAMLRPLLDRAVAGDDRAAPGGRALARRLRALLRLGMDRPMTDLRLTTGERIRILRDRADLTLRDLAERSGVHVSTIHGIESDKTQARVETLQALAAALGVTVAALLGPEEKSRSSLESLRVRRARR